MIIYFRLRNLLCWTKIVGIAVVLFKDSVLCDASHKNRPRQIVLCLVTDSSALFIIAALTPKCRLLVGGCEVTVVPFFIKAAHQSLLCALERDNNLFE